MSLNLPSIMSSSSTISIVDPTMSNNHDASTPVNNPSVGAGSIPYASNFTSSLMVKKDLVLSPLTRIAKGMQSLGLNLRGSGGGAFADQTDVVIDAELERRKQQTRTKIIEM